MAEFMVFIAELLLSTITCRTVQNSLNTSDAKDSILKRGNCKMNHTAKLVGSRLLQSQVVMIKSMIKRKNEMCLFPQWVFCSGSDTHWDRSLWNSQVCECLYISRNQFRKNKALLIFTCITHAYVHTHACLIVRKGKRKMTLDTFFSILVFADADFHSVCSCGCCGCWLLSDRVFCGH